MCVVNASRDRRVSDCAQSSQRSPTQPPGNQRLFSRCSKFVKELCCKLSAWEQTQLETNLMQKKLHFRFLTVFYLEWFGNYTLYLLPISLSILNALGLKGSKKVELGQHKRLAILNMLTNSKGLVPIPFVPSEF